jgi:hypothetical protein
MFGLFAIALLLSTFRGRFRVALVAGFAEAAFLGAAFLEAVLCEVFFEEVLLLLMA